MGRLLGGAALASVLCVAAAAAFAQAAPDAGSTAEPEPIVEPGVAVQSPAAAAANDYPTAVRAEYVFACMATNGQTQDALTRCACSIDQIASVLPYDAYVEAETVFRMRLAGGERGAMFRGTPAVREIAADLRRAQAEAELLCF